MTETVSKSKFKPRALEYFRRVEETGLELVITDRGKPVARIVPFTESPDAALLALRGSVLGYDEPEEPVGLEAWESLR